MSDDKDLKGVEIPLCLTRKNSCVSDREIEDQLSNEEEITEFQEWLAIKRYYTELENSIEIPSDKIFRRISSKISKKNVVGMFADYLGVLRNLTKSIWFPWALVFVQAAIIIYFVIPIHQPRYMTLSADRNGQESAFYVNVIFDEQAKEIDIRNLLTSIGAEIVDGPEPNGLYIIKVPISGSEFSSLERKLKAKKIIRFLAPRY